MTLTFILKANSENWKNSNPILQNGELGFEIDTNKFKIGNGINPWNDLLYYSDDSLLMEIIGSSEIS